MWGEGEFQLGEEKAWETLAGKNPARQEEDGDENWNTILKDITKKGGHFNFCRVCNRFYKKVGSISDVSHCTKENCS
jgi:hypothetical protein